MDWSKIEADMIAAAKAVIAGVWPTVANGTIAGIKALSTIAQEIAASADMNDDEKQQLMSEYKQALTNTLTAYQSIAEAIIQDAISAVLNVLIAAVPSLARFA